MSALALAGCTGEQTAPVPSGTAEASSTEGASTAPTPDETSAAPVALVPGGTAQQNLAFFTQVVTGVWNGPDQVAGRAYIDALSSAGFDKGQMQVTPDESTIGNSAESIEFSVRMGEACLVGQVGPSIGNVVTTVLPGLSSGGCLIGQTRPIDW